MFISFAEKIIEFNRQLRFEKKMPNGISIMNPFQDNPSAIRISSEFYKKYYSDHLERTMILGINPGRHGAGVTGIPFTDTKRLEQICNITWNGHQTHEPSSVFIYDLIDAFGGPGKFYQEFYISSICPLGFIKKGKNKNWLNFNYYDRPDLTKLMIPFMKKCLNDQIKFGIIRDRCFVLGTGKNFQHIKKLNKEWKTFDEIIPLEHPRYIMQYKYKERASYLDKFINLLKL